MTDRDRKNPELDRELDALGEEAAAPEERAAAEGLAARLEGGLHAVEGDAATAEELEALAELSRALGAGGAATRAGAAATSRILDELLGAPGAQGGGPAEGGAPARSETPAPPEAQGAPEPTPEEAPADELEERRAARLGDAVDRLVAGVSSGAEAGLGSEAELLETAAQIRASVHTQAISPARVEAIVEDALGRPARVRRYRGSRVLLAVGLVGTLAASLVGLVLYFGGGAPQGPEVPAHLSSRSTRDILPEAFPRSQTESERIDLVYYDRLRAYRDLELGALAPDPDRAPARPPAATPAFAGRLGGLP